MSWSFPVWRRGGRLVSWLYNGFLVLLLLCFGFLLHSSNFISRFSRSANEEQTTEEPENATLSEAIIRSMIPPEYHKYLASPSEMESMSSLGINKSFVTTNSSASQVILDTEEIKRRIQRHNEEQSVLNEQTFGPLQNNSLVIIVQVHTRLMYLRHLVISLAQARGIQNTVLVFSHDYYDEQINSLVRSIDFCKVIQIFYPYSIQTHPREFPGESPNDCPRNINKNSAIELNCTNANHPDLYGHYREARFTQTKHHWWWKANQIFSKLEVTRNHTGLVLFLEEDHYVAPDFIYMLHRLEVVRAFKCPHCEILSLGTYAKNVNFAFNSNRGEITPWLSSRHNMGMAFNRSVWNQFAACAEKFCTYDDYNWDWSLQFVSNACLQSELTAVMLSTPRVFHIGECGVHHKSSCKSTAALRKVQKLLASSKNYFFPKHFVVGTFTLKKKELRKGNGGWGDIRDVQFCINMTLPVR